MPLPSFRAANALVLAAGLAGLASVPPAGAQELRESYVARLSREDHYNSSGERLRSPAAILRQDRANFHRFNVRDPEDTGDRFFADAENRRLMERFLARGKISRALRDQIVNGEPIVEVKITRARDGSDAVDVTVY